MRFFNRTTRSVAPTEAGTRLFPTAGPIVGDLDIALADLGTFRERLSGDPRIKASKAVARLLMTTGAPATPLRGVAGPEFPATDEACR